MRRRSLSGLLLREQRFEFLRLSLSFTPVCALRALCQILLVGVKSLLEITVSAIRLPEGVECDRLGKGFVALLVLIDGPLILA
jgi:hypothetical protein